MVGLDEAPQFSLTETGHFRTPMLAFRKEGGASVLAALDDHIRYIHSCWHHSESTVEKKSLVPKHHLMWASFIVILNICDTVSSHGNRLLTVPKVMAQNKLQKHLMINAGVVGGEVDESQPRLPQPVNTKDEWRQSRLIRMTEKIMSELWMYQLIIGTCWQFNLSAGATEQPFLGHPMNVSLL